MGALVGAWGVRSYLAWEDAENDRFEARLKRITVTNQQEDERHERVRTTPFFASRSTF